MTFIEQISERFKGSQAFENRKYFDIEGCKLNFNGLPLGSIVLDVDKLIENDNYVGRITSHHSQRLSICDYVVFALDGNQCEIILIEAKGGLSDDEGYEAKAITQLDSSYKILQRAIGECEIELADYSVKTVYVMAAIDWGGLFGQTITIDQVIESEIRPQRVSSGFDVWEEIHRN